MSLGIYTEKKQELRLYYSKYTDIKHNTKLTGIKTELQKCANIPNFCFNKRYSLKFSIIILFSFFTSGYVANDV